MILCARSQDISENCEKLLKRCKKSDKILVKINVKD